MICSIPDCGKAVHRRGLCNAHYKRLLRHGDPLGGGTAWGEPARFLNGALAYTGTDCLLWPYGRSSTGAGMIGLDGRMQLVSRIVCAKTHGPPPTPEHHAAHSCGKGDLGCISPTHLDWKTPAENEADKLMHGTMARGERHGAAKLTEANVHEIRSLQGAMTQIEIGEMFGVSAVAIGDIHAGRNWGWLEEGA